MHLPRLPPRLRLFRIRMEIWLRRMDRTNTLGLAAQVAFWVFLALLPLAAVLGLVVARLALAQSDIVAGALASLPTAARDLIGTELARVAAWNGGTVAPVAAVTFVWLASGGVQSIFDALELQVGVARPWWRKKLLAIAGCVVLSVGAAVIAGIAMGATWMFRAVKTRVVFTASPHLDPVWQGVRVASVFVVAVALMCGLYWLGTPPKARARVRVLPGALFAVVFDGATGWGYGVSLKITGIGAGYQAGLAAIGVTMTSLYLLSLGVLAGASLNHLLAVRLRSVGRVAAPRVRRAGDLPPPEDAAHPGHLPKPEPTPTLPPSPT